MLIGEGIFGCLSHCKRNFTNDMNGCNHMLLTVFIVEAILIWWRPLSAEYPPSPQVRIQETQAELPRGSIPRSVEVILRAEAVESAQAGDKCDFTGSLIVVPDVSQLSTPGLWLLLMTSGTRPSCLLWELLF